MLRFGRTRLCGTALVFLVLTARALAADHPLGSLGIGWSVRLASPLLDTPAVDTRRVYLPLRSGRIVALSLVDGRESWTRDVPLTRGLTTDGARLFTATDAELLAFDADSGRTMWHVPLPGVIVAPAARGGWVLAAVGLEILAFRAENGRLVWRTVLHSPSVAPPVIDGDRAYVSLADGSIAAVNIVDGQVAWRSPLRLPCGAVSVAGNRVFAGCEDNFFYALDPQTGNRKWRWRTGADVLSPAALDGDRVYFASLDNLIRALDFGSGVQRWRHSLDSRPLSGPVLAGDVLVVSVASGIRAVSAKDGSVAGVFSVPGELAAPAVFPPQDAAPAAAIAVIVTGAATGDWRVYGLVRSPEPAPTLLKEIPGRPLSPDDPPTLPGPPRPGAPRPL